jgi:8-oxo-dGTP diphosphatase
VIEHDCVGGLLVRGGEVLLGRRADDRDWLPGTWDLFGGHIVPGETAADTLRRELREELGIDTGAIRALATLESAEGRWRLQVFAVDHWTGDPHNRQPQEHAELRWMPPAEAQAKLAHVHPMFAAAIAKASSPEPDPAGP